MSELFGDLKPSPARTSAAMRELLATEAAAEAEVAHESEPAALRELAATEAAAMAEQQAQERRRSSLEEMSLEWHRPMPPPTTPAPTKSPVVALFDMVTSLFGQRRDSERTDDSPRSITAESFVHSRSMSLNDALGDQLYYGSSRGEHVYYWDAEEVEGPRSPTARNVASWRLSFQRGGVMPPPQKTLRFNSSVEMLGFERAERSAARMQRWQEKKASVDLKDDALAAALVC